jgi:hypothetical protein
MEEIPVYGIFSKGGVGSLPWPFPQLNLSQAGPTSGHFPGLSGVWVLHYNVVSAVFYDLLISFQICLEWSTANLM